MSTPGRVADAGISAAGNRPTLARIGGLEPPPGVDGGAEKRCPCLQMMEKGHKRGQN